VNNHFYQTNNRFSRIYFYGTGSSGRASGRCHRSQVRCAPFIPIGLCITTKSDLKQKKGRNIHLKSHNKKALTAQSIFFKLFGIALHYTFLCGADMHIRFFCLIFVVVLLFTSSLPAQWHGDGTQCSESRFELLSLPVIPEYHTDMPLDCIIGHIVLDSALRSTDDIVLRSFINNTSLDTLRVLARFAYAMIDYNPVLFQYYGITVNRQLWNNNPALTYSDSPLSVLTTLKSRLQLEAGTFRTISKDYVLLVTAPYILHIRISDVVRGRDTTFSRPTSYINVACNVLETIKGQHLPSNCFYTAAVVGKQTPESVPPCLLFGYPEGWTTAAGFSDIPSSASTVKTVQAGEEYFAFLGFGAITVQDNYLTIIPNFEPAGGLFQIKDGRVNDPGNFWGLGTAPTVQQFRDNLTSKINDIKSWWLP
jgi:hypothetical protein